MFVDPVTDQEWQQVVNNIEVLELIDSARSYGLIKGGPEINRERCDELMAKAREKGIFVNRDAVTHTIAEMMEGS